jgi:hypothetical protein
MSMYEKEMRGEKYSKTEHRRYLKPKLNQRSDGSIEFKHQNISAVLLDSGYPYIKGYKPAKNYQSLLRDVVHHYLSMNEEIIIAQSDSLIEARIRSQEVDWNKVVARSPERLLVAKEVTVRDFTPKKYNYAERESNNRKLGKLGEEFVLSYEKFRLSEMGREDLVNEIEWTSRLVGDGAGYDIRSFDGRTEDELFIEVKTTNSGIYQPFFVSDNEVSFSEIYAKQYSLYRVFQFRDDPKLFSLSGDLRHNVNLQPKTYRASF